MPTPDPCIICTLQHDFMRQQQCIPLTPALSDTLQVRTLIDAQKALNEEAPRIIYGRSNAMQELKVHEQMFGGLLSAFTVSYRWSSKFICTTR